MGFLKKVNKKETIRYETEDGEDFIDLRAGLTKGEVNQIMLAAPTQNTKPVLDDDGVPLKDDMGNPVLVPADPKADMEGGLKFLERFLDVCLTGWSMTDEDGNPVPPSVEAYRELSPEAGAWVDGELNKHIQTVMGRRTADVEGKPSKSETTQPSETESSSIS